jgi:xanthine dehydrogenase YagS FAD-binding subunit
MRPFIYDSPLTVQEATSRVAPESAFIAGGTTLLDLMKLEVLNPALVVDINQLPMRGI